MIGPCFPVDGKPWRLTMGLRLLHLDRWLEVDHRRSEELALKHRLLTGSHDRVFVALPRTEPAGVECLQTVIDHLGQHHPGLVSTTPGRLHEHTLDVVVDLAGLHPVDAAARVVQEDLCLMVHDGRSWVLGAASVCFPSRWSLTAKLGRDLSAIHSPVPGYEEALAAPTNAFFDRLRSDRPVWRLNWTLLDSAALHQPDPGHRSDPVRRSRTSDMTINVPDLSFRVERQTLRALPDTGAVVFTIRTYVTSLDELIGADPEMVPALRATLRTVPDATVEYKGWSGLLGPLLEWLDDRMPGP